MEAELMSAGVCVAAPPKATQCSSSSAGGAQAPPKARKLNGLSGLFNWMFAAAPKSAGPRFAPVGKSWRPLDFDFAGVDLMGEGDEESQVPQMLLNKYSAEMYVLRHLLGYMHVPLGRREV